MQSDSPPSVFGLVDAIKDRYSDMSNTDVIALARLMVLERLADDFIDMIEIAINENPRD